jgi:hypothetical protein
MDPEPLLNDVDPQAWFADVLARITDTRQLAAVELGRQSNATEGRLTAALTGRLR